MPLPSLDEDGLRAIAWELGMVVMVVAALVPIWAPQWLPLQDLPQHLAAIRVFSDYGDPQLNLAYYFELTPFQTQYLGYYGVVWLLSLVFEIEVANRLFISICLAGTPYAMRYLLARLDRPAYLALFAFPLLYNTFLILGFINFIAAIPLMLWGLGLAARLREDYSVGLAVGLGIVGFVCFYMHVVPFAFLAVGAGLLGLGGSVRGTLKRWIPMLPAGLTSIAWTFWSPAGRSTSKAVGKGADFKPWATALREMPDWLINPAPGPADIHILIVYSLLIIAAIACGVGYRRRTTETEADSPADRLFPYFQRVAILAPLAFVGYFALPTSYQWIWPIAPRFALLGVFLLIPALPTARRLPAALIIAGLVVVSFQYFSFVDQNFRDFSQKEVGDLQPALDTIPPGQRVAGLIFDRNSQHARFSPFIHYVAYYQAQKGGAVMFTFADFPQSPFRFREDNRPPKVRPRWEWTPHQVDPKKELDWYNYVLVRGGPGEIARQKETYEQVYDGDKWSVWHRQTPP